MSDVEKFIESHVNGRKHKQHVTQKERKEITLKCSIYVKGFDPLISNLEEELQKYFEELDGEVKDVYVDKNKVCLL